MAKFTLKLKKVDKTTRSVRDNLNQIPYDYTVGRKVMTNLDSIFKSRDITLPTKVRLVKVMVFPVVMYGCESWTVKKAECRRIDAFERWCWRRFLRVPWTARRSNRSILKEISPGISLERMMLKLKLQYFGHLMRRADSLEDSDAGRDWGQEEKGTPEDEMAGWHHWLDGRESEWTPGVGDGQGGLACCDSWSRKESDTTEPLSWLNWTEAPLSMGFSRQDWGGLPFPPAGDLPDPRIEPKSLMSPALAWQVGSLPLAPPERREECIYNICKLLSWAIWKRVTDIMTFHPQISFHLLRIRTFFYVTTMLLLC